MATSSFWIDAASFVQPDGSTNNIAPGQSRRQGTQATRKVAYITLDFDGAGIIIESAHAKFGMPINYASGLSADVHYMANATAGTVKWNIEIGATTAGDVDTPNEHAFAAANAGAAPTVNTTEARREMVETITLTNADSVAAGDLVMLCISRDPANDTCAADAELLGVRITYTTT